MKRAALGLLRGAAEVPCFIALASGLVLVAFGQWGLRNAPRIGAARVSQCKWCWQVVPPGVRHIATDCPARPKRP